MQNLVGGLCFEELPLIIGAGASKSLDQVLNWTSVYPVVGGSYTVAPCAGNEGQLFAPDNFADIESGEPAINRYGLLNPGVDLIIQKLPYVNHAHPFIASVAACDCVGYHYLIERFMSHPFVSAIELNLSCPNTEQEPLGFQEENLDRFLDTVRVALEVYGADVKPLWCKVPPYSNLAQLRRIAKIINRHKTVIAAVVSCNTIPAMTVISGGLSGPHLFPIACRQVMEWRGVLDSEISLIASGGVLSGDEIVVYLQDLGADAVQVTTLLHWLDNPNEMNRILTQSERLCAYLEKIYK